MGNQLFSNSMSKPPYTPYELCQPFSRSPTGPNGEQYPGPSTPFTPLPQPSRPFSEHPTGPNGEKYPGPNPGVQSRPRPYTMQDGVSQSPQRPHTRNNADQEADPSSAPFMSNPQDHPWISACNQVVARGLRWMDPSIGDSIAQKQSNAPPATGVQAPGEDFQFRKPYEFNHCNPAQSEFVPEVDVYDVKEAFVVRVSLPGGKKEDCAVNWDSETMQLRISGTIASLIDGQYDSAFKFQRQERKTGSFRRKISFSTGGRQPAIDADSITAEMTDDVLEIEVPKAQPMPDTQKTINIK